MLKKHMKTRWKIYIYIIIAVTMIFILSLKDISKLTNIIVINDEFGYWGSAAQLASKNWSELLATTPYYSYGYSILLIPLFLLNLPAQAMYQVAVFLNAILLVMSYFLCFYCGNKIFPAIKTSIMSILALTVILYTNTIIQAQVAWSESLLYFLYWLIFALAVQLLDSFRGWKLILFVLSNAYIYMVHQRSVGVVIASCIFLVIFFMIEKLNKRYIFYGIFCGITLFLIHTVLKNYLINSIFTTKEMVSMNDYSGQLGKLEFILKSKDGFFSFLESICGKLYYLGGATFLVAFTSAWISLKQTLYCFKCLVKRNQGDEKLKNQLIGWFLFTSFGATFLIDAIAMNHAVGRLDILIYGRYMEFAIGPVLLFGFGNFINLRKPQVMILKEGTLLLILSIIVNHGLIQVNSNEFNAFCATTMNWFFNGRIQVPYLACYIAVICVCAAFSICILMNWLKRVKFHGAYDYVPYILLSVLWIFLLKGAPAIASQQYVQDIIKPIVDIVDELGNDKPVYVLCDENDDVDSNYAALKYLQFNLYNNPVHVIFGLEEITDQSNCYILSIKGNANSEDSLEEGYSLISQSKQLKLYVAEESNLDKDYEKYAKDFQYNVFNNMTTDLIEEGAVGQNYSFCGPYINLPRGSYKVTYMLESNASQDDLGFCDISSNKGENIIKTVPITKEMFINGKSKVTIEFSLYKMTNNIEFRACLNEGIVVNLTDIYYQQNKKTYTPGADDSEGLLDLISQIQTLENDNDIIYLNTTEDAIDVSYLKKGMPERNVYALNIDKVKTIGDSTCVIADKRDFEWMQFLPEHIILAQSKNHLLLVPTSEVSDGRVTFSDGKAVKLEFLQKQQDLAYLSNIYDLKDGGEYIAYLNLSPQSIGGKLHVEVLSGQTILEDVVNIDYKEKIEVPFAIYDSVDNLRFNIYSEESHNLIPYNSGLIIQNKTGIRFIYDKYLAPLLTKIDNWKGDGYITIVSNNWRENQKKDIQKYLQNSRKVTFLTWDKDNTSNLNEDFLITTPDTDIAYNLLTNYQAISRTNRYVLWVHRDNLRHKIPSLELLAYDKTLSAKFFDIVDDEGVVDRRISLPEGSYQMVLNLTVLNDINLEEHPLQIRIWDGAELIKTQYVSDIDTPIIVSSQYGISKLHYDILEEGPGTIYAELNGIVQISKGFQIDLSKMAYFNGIYSERDNSISSSGDTVYGPYLSLELGKYDVLFYYESSVAQDITFDIAANVGEIVCNSDEAEYSKSGLGFVAKFSLDIHADLENVEFRTYIPEGVSCKLKAITIEKIED